MTLAEEVIAALEDFLKIDNIAAGDRLRHRWTKRNGTVTRVSQDMFFASILMDGDDIPRLLTDTILSSYTRAW